MLSDLSCNPEQKSPVGTAAQTPESPFNNRIWKVAERPEMTMRTFDPASGPVVS